MNDNWEPAENILNYSINIVNLDLLRMTLRLEDLCWNKKYYNSNKEAFGESTTRKGIFLFVLAVLDCNRLSIWIDKEDNYFL